MLLLLVLKVLLGPSPTEPPGWYAMESSAFWQTEALALPIVVKDFDRDLAAAALWHSTNDWRSAQGLAPYQYHQANYRAARYHSRRMGEQQALQHSFRSPAHLREFFQRLAHYGGDFSASAENIAQLGLWAIPAGQAFRWGKKGRPISPEGEAYPRHSYRSLAQWALKQWLESPPHRRNLEKAHHYLGCGISAPLRDAQGRYVFYLTQNFSTP